jgi:hypothetical protein
LIRLAPGTVLDWGLFMASSLNSEECYVNWIKRLILFHNKRHPVPHCPLFHTTMFLAFLS